MNAAYRRAAADVAIQAALGRFFAHKLRAGVLWEIHTISDDGPAAVAALRSYQQARAAWLDAVQAGSVYVDDITLRVPSPGCAAIGATGCLPIDADLAQMARLAADANGGGLGLPSGAGSAAAQVLATPPARGIDLAHTPTVAFHRGQDLVLVLEATDLSARLHVRHVNQAEAWQEVTMTR